MDGAHSPQQAEHSFESFFPGMGGPADERMSIIVQTMREMSTHTDPEQMVSAYAQRMARILPSDRRLSLSRRGLDKPGYRITRSNLWSEQPNPWKQQHKLPLLSGGLIGDLIYANEPRFIEDCSVDANDPAAEYLGGQRSIIAVPLYDRGEALNMVILSKNQPRAFSPDVLPELVWMSNLFGKATQSLVLAGQLQDAYRTIDAELEEVARIQRFLLPRSLPVIPGLHLAADYKTSRRAGGDYYDFFQLDRGRWGILIADVSGHGTPAAVFMAITRTLVHAMPKPLSSPGEMLKFLNDELSTKYALSGMFVTAFFGIYDALNRKLTYASAGHNPPRVKHCAEDRLSFLDEAQQLPLGITADIPYPDATITLAPGDQVIFYTDGITEARNPQDEQFDVSRLDDVLNNCSVDADCLMTTVLDAVKAFTGGQPPEDDQTLIVGKVVD